MPILEHLFLKGEFAERKRLLSGLTFEQVSIRFNGAPHSIYEELWHATAYQTSIIDPSDPNRDRFPTEQPTSEQQWHDLVEKFLKGAQTAADLESEPERLAAEVQPGLTLGEDLQCVAIHNAYHLGKIMAIRQQMGAWPPEKE